MSIADITVKDLLVII